MEIGHQVPEWQQPPFVKKDHFFTDGDTISTDPFEGGVKVSGDFDDYLKMKLDGVALELKAGKLVAAEIPEQEPEKTVEVSREDEILGELASIDFESSTDRTWREFVIKNADDFAPEAVERLREFESRAITLRNELGAL